MAATRGLAVCACSLVLILAAVCSALPAPTTLLDTGRLPVGARAIITTAQLDSLFSGAIPLVSKMLRELKLAPIEGRIGLPPLISLEYRISDLVFDTVGLGTGSLKTIKNWGLGGSVGVVEIHLSFTYFVRLRIFGGEEVVHTHCMGLLSDEHDVGVKSVPPECDGTSARSAEEGEVKEETARVTMHMKGGKVELKVAVDDQSDGVPHLDVDTLEMHVDWHEENIEGGGGVISWLWKTFGNLLFDGAVNVVLNSIGSTMETQVNEALKNLPLRFGVTERVGVDGRLSGSPTYTSESMSVSDRLVFYELKSGGNPPVPYPNLPDALDASCGAGFVVSSSVVSSGLYSLWHSGSLSFSLEDKDVPPEMPLRLRTEWFREWLPTLYEKYPDRPMSVRIWADSCPLLKFGKDLSEPLHFLGDWNVEVSVILASGERVKVLLLESVSRADVSWEITSGRVRAQIGGASLKWTVRQSFIGTVSLDKFSQAMQSVVDFGVFLLNGMLGEGIEIPSSLGPVRIRDVRAALATSDYIGICGKLAVV